MNDYKNEYENVHLALTALLLLAFIIGIFLFMYLLTLLITDSDKFIENHSQLLAAFFILLASAIASASVMTSIKSNELLKQKDISRNKKD